MSKKIWIGIGQLGCAAAELLAEKTAGKACVLAVDTDRATEYALQHAKSISLADPRTVDKVLADLDAAAIGKWFPCDPTRVEFASFTFQYMNDGAGMWRKKAMLAFAAYLARPEEGALHRELAAFAAETGGEAELGILASLSGGTGSGLLLPLTLYVTRELAARGVKVNAIRAVLAPPEILEGKLGNEQLLRARANAFAAMAEWRSVFAPASQEKSADGITSLPFGGKDDPYFGDLFSHFAHDEEKQCRPFGQVAVCRKQAELHTVEDYARLMTDIARLQGWETVAQTEKTNDAPFAEWTLSHTVYPLERVVAYIADRSVQSLVEEKILPMQKQTDRALAQIRAGVYENRLLFRYRESALAEAVHAAACLQDALCEGMAEDIPVMIAHLADRIGESFHTESTDRIAQWQASVTEPRGVRAAWRRLFRIEDRPFAEQAAQSRLWLTDHYTQCMERSSQTKELTQQISQMISQEMIRREGRVLHPTAALVRLATAYREVERMLGAGNEESVSSMLRGAQLPAEWLRAESASEGKGRYCRFGTTRLFTRFENAQDRRVAILTADDRAAFMADVKLVHDRVVRHFTVDHLRHALALIGARLNSYYRLYATLTELTERPRPEVKEQPLGGRVRYVGVSDSELADTYASYRAWESDEYREQIVAREMLLGEAMETAPTEHMTAITPWLTELHDRLWQTAKTQCHACGFAEDLSGQSVLHQLYRAACYAPDMLRNAFAEGMYPTYYYVSPPHTGDGEVNAVCHRALLILPAAEKTYVEKHPEIFGEGDAARAVETLLGQYGNIPCRVVFTEEQAPHRFTLCRESLGMRFADLEWLRETPPRSPCAVAYQKALAKYSECRTEIWNPHLSIHLSAKAESVVSPGENLKQKETRSEPETIVLLLSERRAQIYADLCDQHLGEQNI
ncbi:MAG: hypothetical protein IJW99_06270 [Clostridia bacterium]|nr:hypothetical protein [Clostridia bacterium]